MRAERGGFSALGSMTGFDFADFALGSDLVEFGCRLAGCHLRAERHHIEEARSDWFALGRWLMDTHPWTTASTTHV